MFGTRSRVAGACLLAYGAVVVRYSRAPGRGERRVFAWMNSGGHHRWLRLPQQWGTPWTLPLVAAVAVARGRRRDALTALLCLPVEKAVEVATKKLRPRPRPVFHQPTELRDDAPVDGGSMPSGHAALAACGTVLLAPLVPFPVGVLAAMTAGASAWVRVHQGAHEPADVVAGLLLGTAVSLAVTDLVDQVLPACHRGRVGTAR